MTNSALVSGVTARRIWREALPDGARLTRPDEIAAGARGQFIAGSASALLPGRPKSDAVRMLEG